MWSSLPPTNTSKIYLLVEQFSMKVNWKLAEGFLYNQSCKKDKHEVKQEGKESNKVETCAPRKGLRGKKRLHRWIPALESERLSHKLSTPVLGSYAEETSPLGWLEDCWDKQKCCGKPRLVRSMCTGYPPDSAERGLLQWLLDFQGPPHCISQPKLSK